LLPIPAHRASRSRPVIPDSLPPTPRFEVAILNTAVVALEYSRSSSLNEAIVALEYSRSSSLNEAVVALEYNEVVILNEVKDLCICRCLFYARCLCCLTSSS
jgi:hypothetical protein